MELTAGSLEPDQALFAMVDALDEHLEIMSAETHAAFSVLHHAVAAFEAGADDLIISQANRVRFMLIGKPEAFDPREEAIARFLLAAADAAIKLAGYSSTQPDPTGVLEVVKQRWAALQSVFDAHRKQAAGDLRFEVLDGGPTGQVRAWDGERRVGFLLWDTDDGNPGSLPPGHCVVTAVRVEPSHRGIGLSRELLERAHEAAGRPFVIRTFFTPHGERWAQRMAAELDYVTYIPSPPGWEYEDPETSIWNLSAKEALAFDDQRAWQLTDRLVDKHGDKGWAPITTVQQAEHEMRKLVGPSLQVPVSLDPSKSYGEAHVAWSGSRAVGMVLAQAGVPFIAFLHEVAHLVAGFQGQERHSEAWAREFARKLRETGYPKAAEDWEVMWMADGLDFYYGSVEPLAVGARIETSNDGFADYGFAHQTQSGAVWDAENRWNHEWHEDIEDKVYIYVVKAIGGHVEMVDRPGIMDPDEVYSPGGWRVVKYLGSKAATASKTSALRTCGMADGRMFNEVPVVYLAEWKVREELQGYITTFANYTAVKEYLRRILEAEGVPHADEAFVQRNLDNPNGARIGWMRDAAVLVPFVQMGHNAMDLMTLVHESAHIVTNRGVMAATTEEAHRDEWLDNYQRMLSRWLPRAAERLAEYLTWDPADLEPNRPRRTASRIRYEVVPQSTLQHSDYGVLVYAWDGERKIGRLEANYHWGHEGEYEPTWHVWHIYVEEDYRRQNIGRGMVKALRDEFPDHLIIWSGFVSIEGEDFARSLDPEFNRVVSKTAFAERLDWRVVDPRPERQTVEAVYLGIRFRLQGRDKDPSGNGGWTLDILEPGDDVQLVVLHHHQFEDDYWNREVKRYHDTLEEAQRYVEERIIGTGMVDQMLPRDLFPQGSTRYHLTLARHVPGILSRGLEPRSQVGTGTSVFSELRKVTSILWDLKDEDWAAYQNEPIALLELDVSGLPRSTVKALGGEERVNDIIEPSRISVLVADIPWYLTDAGFSSWSMSESEALALLRGDPAATRRAWVRSEEDLEALVSQAKTATFQHPVGVMEDAHTKDGTEGKSFTTLKAVAEFLRETLWSAGSVREVLVADKPDKVSGDLIGDRTGVIVVTEAPGFFSSGGVGADARAFVSPVPQSPPIDYVLYLPRLPVSEMVLLHEAAHIINGLQGGSFGHESDWAKLYIKLLDGSWDPDLQGLANLVRYATGLGTTAVSGWQDIEGLEFEMRGRAVRAWTPEARERRRALGVIVWEEDGEVRQVKVDEGYRRRGLATELWRRAKEVEPRLHHSERLTEDGRAWSEVTAVRGDGDGFVYTEDGDRYWGVHGAAGLLVRHLDEEGTTWFFLQKRSGAVEEGGTWSIPGGAIDSHETPTQTALREFAEETELPTHGLGIVGTYVSQPVPEWSYTTVVAETPDALDTPDLVGWEQEDSGWFTLDEMRSMNLHPGLRESLDDVARFAIARPATVYRGFAVQFSPQEWEEVVTAFEANSKSYLADLALTKAIEQRETLGPRFIGEGVGVHWSLDLKEAHRFAGQSSVQFDSRYLPVVMEGNPESGAFREMDPKVLDEYALSEFEEEVPLRAGAEVRLSAVHVWLPDREVGERWRRPDREDPYIAWAEGEVDWPYEDQHWRIPVSRTVTAADHQTGHRPAAPDYGPGAHEVNAGTHVPADVLEHPEWYTGFREFADFVVAQLRPVQGNPDGPVTIYRAQPSEFDTIRPGDWVTLSRRYAEQHALYDDDFHIVSAEVPARDVVWAMDDLMEWGYWGETVPGFTREAAANTEVRYEVTWDGEDMRVIAHAEDKPGPSIMEDDIVGELLVRRHQDGQWRVKGTWVDRSHRRRGIATGMIAVARDEVAPEPISLTQEFTEAGEAWGRTVDLHLGSLSSLDQAPVPT